MLVAPPSVSPAGDLDDLSFGDEIGQDLACLLVAHDRAERQGNRQVLPPLAVAVRAQAVLAASGFEPRLMAKRIERVHRWVGREVDVAAVAPVAARRSPTGNEFFAPERDAPVATVSGLHMDMGFVDEHDSPTKKKPRNAGLACGRKSRSVDERLDGDIAAQAPPVAEHHHTGNLRKERVILATADVDARAELRAPLPDDDRAAGDRLPAEGLHAETRSEE